MWSVDMVFGRAFDVAGKRPPNRQHRACKGMSSVGVGGVGNGSGRVTKRRAVSPRPAGPRGQHDRARTSLVDTQAALFQVAKKARKLRVAPAKFFEIHACRSSTHFARWGCDRGARQSLTCRVMISRITGPTLWSLLWVMSRTDMPT